MCPLATRKKTDICDNHQSLFYIIPRLQLKSNVSNAEKWKRTIFLPLGKVFHYWSGLFALSLQSRRMIQCPVRCSHRQLQLYFRTYFSFFSLSPSLSLSLHSVIIAQYSQLPQRAVTWRTRLSSLLSLYAVQSTSTCPHSKAIGCHHTSKHDIIHCKFCNRVFPTMCVVRSCDILMDPILSDVFSSTFKIELIESFFIAAGRIQYVYGHGVYIYVHYLYNMCDIEDAFITADDIEQLKVIVICSISAWRKMCASSPDANGRWHGINGSHVGHSYYLL